MHVKHVHLVIQTLVDFDQGEQLQHGRPEPGTDDPTRHTRTLFARARGGDDQPREFAHSRGDKLDE